MNTRMVDLIEAKRDGKALTTEQIAWFVRGVTDGTLPNYQITALLMAIFFQGMDHRETVDLTLAMAHSGDELDLHDVAEFVVDKHSSGGVGDKTTLVVQPLVAACGLPVGKTSGRGLASSGGTLDKMESIRGWTSDLTLAQFKRQLADIGLVLAGQTSNLAPADGRLYELRDVTGTVPSKPLIAASIMSKKLASGADGILLDVKTGSGAFMETVDAASELAETMVNIGEDAGRNMIALISDMNQPLGHAVGNALEVAEAIATLQGDGPDDFWAHCLEVATQMLRLARRDDNPQKAREQIINARSSGNALEKLRQMVAAQCGDVTQVDRPETLPQAEFVEDILADRGGYIAAMDTGALGWAAVHLGAGREEKGQPIDRAVGFVLPVKIGDEIAPGDLLVTIHANDREKLQQARSEILGALTWSDEPVQPLPHFYDAVRA
jgi:pyrimidine-nucleoside phosphorylase